MENNVIAMRAKRARAKRYQLFSFDTTDCTMFSRSFLIDTPHGKVKVIKQFPIRKWGMTGNEEV